MIPGFWRVGASVLAALLSLAGCAASAPMDLYVPAHCHGVSEPFGTYSIRYESVPGFISGVIESAVTGALAAQSLEPVQGDGADVRVVVRFDLIDRNPPAPEGDPFGEPLGTGELNRFVTHLAVDVRDLRRSSVREPDGPLIWTGAMYRAHAIQGGETFHDERAALVIRKAFDDMFVGLTEACE